MSSNYLKVFVAVTAVILMSGTRTYATSMDENIVASAHNSYVFKTYFKDDRIVVTSNEGAVVLKGTVAEEAHIKLAKETVANLPAVVSVDNQLTVKGPAEESDGWIGVQIKYSLLYNRHVSGLNTHVSVTDGIVTLRGEADNQAQKDLAEEYAKDVKGVKEVKNKITIAKKVEESKGMKESEMENDTMDDKNTSEDKKSMGDKIDDASITAQVKMAFLFHQSTSVFKTGVHTNDGIVTLTGVANSPAGKDMAAKVANDVHGVVNVVNNMTIKDASTK